MLAVANFEEQAGHYPPAFIADQNGQPLLSWRVLLLPYLDEQKLYEQFHLDEPWNSPHNIQLLDQMPGTYRLHTRAADDAATTNYVAVVGDATMWQGAAPRDQNFVTDGLSNTLLIAEFVGHDIPWTKPEDLVFNEMDLTVDSDQGICSVLTPPAFVTVDGFVTYLPRETTARDVRALLTANGGENFSIDRLPRSQDGRLGPRK